MPMLARKGRLGSAAVRNEPEPEDMLIDTTMPMLEEAETRSIDFLTWAARVPEPKGPLDFERFPFQPEMYRALGDCKEGVVQKSTQVGVSAFLVRWTMYWPDTRGVTALYVFPKNKQMYDFSDTRVKPLIEGSEYLTSRMPHGSVRNKGLKKVGIGHVYYRGSESKHDLQSVDADLVALDEYDDLSPGNIPDAERRISGSQLGLIRRVGVPTTPEWGIARAYTLSDRRRWFVECEHCGEWQHIDFWKNIEIELDDQREVKTATRVCRHCRKPIDVSKGEWVAEYPERDTPGFHVSRLIVPGADMKTIARASREKDAGKVEVFHNKDLGLPISNATGGLDRETIAAAVSAAEERYGGPVPQLRGYAGDSLVTMGVDVASARNLNVRISEHLDSLYQPGHKKRALHIGEVESFDELAKLMSRYNVTIACIDHMPDYRLAMGFAERFAGRAYTVHYANGQLEPLVLDTESRRVSVLRVPVIDATIEVMRAQRNLLPGELPSDYVDHMVANRRKNEKDQFGRETVRYEASGPDDYFQAEVYDLVATEVLKIRLEVEAATEPEVAPLDDLMEFRRGTVNDPNDMEYRPGPGGTDYYSSGPGDDGDWDE